MSQDPLVGIRCQEQREALCRDGVGRDLALGMGL